MAYVHYFLPLSFSLTAYHNPFVYNYMFRNAIFLQFGCYEQVLYASEQRMSMKVGCFF